MNDLAGDWKQHHSNRPPANFRRLAALRFAAAWIGHRASMLDIWKHSVHRRPMRYTPMFWSIVFPLGMYAVASFRLSGIAGAAALDSWSLAMAWVALAAWCATSAGLLLVSLRSARALIGLSQMLASTAPRRARNGR